MWAQPKIPREQSFLFSPSLDEIIEKHHSVRQLDTIFKELDWSQWEAKYDRTKGQPPIHPRILAGIILYGLMNKIRSSRQLEDATRHRIDFMWFLHNESIDHSTFAKFRVQFKDEIVDLFRQMNQQAIKKDYMTLLELSLDGSKFKACSSKQGARKSKHFEKALFEAEAKIERALLEMDNQDVKDYPELAGSKELRNELEFLEREAEKLRKLLSLAKKRDQRRRKKVGKKAESVSIPVNDSDSYMLKNKKGGYSPNYTPTVCVDKDSGMIVHADVVEGDAESDCVLPAIKEVQEIYKKTPEVVSCDTGLGSGANQMFLEEQGIDIYTPVDNLPDEKNKALRSELSQPVAEKLWPELSYNKKGEHLTKSSFIYDEKNNCYWCPMGKSLDFAKTRMQANGRGEVRQNCYTCTSCENCLLATKCLSKKAKSRTVVRSEFEACKQRTAERMNTEHGQAAYKRRAHNAETPFGIIKQAMGIRHFFTIGKESVKSEWMWICSALNLKKLLNLMQKQQIAVG